MEIKLLEIKDLLAKFQNVLFLGEFKIESVVEILYIVLGIKVKRENIKIKNNTIFLNIKPIYKNEIFMNKERIICMLEESLDQKAPKDIR